MNRRNEREAWTAHVEGRKVKTHKYGAEREGKYASKREAETAAQLKALESSGVILDLREQVKFELIPGKNGVSGISYIADFTWIEGGVRHVADCKPWDKKTRKFLRTGVFQIKKRMMYLLLGITIEEL